MDRATTVSLAPGLPPNNEGNMARCFVIQPFDRGPFDQRYEEVIKPAILAAKLEPYRVDEDHGVEVPIDDIERGIRESAVCVADITLDNPNVWYEVGYAFASNRPVCLICSDARTSKYPFDIQHRRIIGYSGNGPSDFEALRDKITGRLRALSDRASQIELAAQMQVSADGGLAPHELVALCLIFTNDAVSDAESSGGAVQSAMDSAGFTAMAASVALQRLLDRKFVECNWRDSEFENESRFKVYSCTAAGKRWIVENEGKLNLRKQAPKSWTAARDADLPPDIPF